LFGLALTAAVCFGVAAVVLARRGPDRRGPDEMGNLS
jgi:hypothetical protein